MSRKWDFKAGGSRSFPRRGTISWFLNSDFVNLLLKVMWEGTECLMLLFWSALSFRGRVVSWKEGKWGRVMRWQAGKGGKIMRLQGGKAGRVVSQEGGRYLILFKAEERRVGSKFHVFVFIVNQWKKEAG